MNIAHRLKLVPTSCPPLLPLWMIRNSGTQFGKIHYNTNPLHGILDLPQTGSRLPSELMPYSFSFCSWPLWSIQNTAFRVIFIWFISQNMTFLLKTLKWSLLWLNVKTKGLKILSKAQLPIITLRSSALTLHLACSILATLASFFLLPEFAPSSTSESLPLFPLFGVFFS